MADPARIQCACGLCFRAIVDGDVKASVTFGPTACGSVVRDHVALNGPKARIYVSDAAYVHIVGFAAWTEGERDDWCRAQSERASKIEQVELDEFERVQEMRNTSGAAEGVER